MAISRIAGQMLQTNLERDGVNLSFSNLDLGNSTPVLYLDVGNNRVGINKSSASYTLDVVGSINSTTDITSSTVSASGNVTAGNVLTSTVYSTSTFTLNTTSNGNILLTPDGTGIAKAIGTNGFVIPAGNIIQRPGTPDTGTIRFNTQNLQLEVWDGTQWIAATNNTSVITNQTINGDGSTSAFSLDQSATAESILVSINGVVQTPGVDYTTTTSPAIITFTTTPASGDVIQVRFIVSTTTLTGIQNGSSNILIPTSNGNITFSAGGVANVFNITSTGANVAGYANITGNISGGNLSLTGNITTANVTNSVTAGNVLSNGILSATGNITGGNLSVGSGYITTGNIINSNANGVGNIGSSTTYFNTVFAKATSAQYADLAEFYSADDTYTPGTVVSFGGNFEVTISTVDADPCVAGVVSTNPSYIMNSGINAEFPTQVALTGRVPCRVTGPVTKGAMMVSAGNGCARAEKSPAMGTVIGKALEAFDGAEGTIEIVVGRL